MFDKKKLSSPLAASCGSWCSRDGVSLVEAAKQHPMSAAPIVSLQKLLEKCEPTIRHSAVMRTEAFISFYLNQDGAFRMLTYVGIYPCDASCKIRGSCWSIRVLQNDSPCSQTLQYFLGGDFGRQTANPSFSSSKNVAKKLHPRKLTCPLKINGWKMYFLLKQSLLLVIC